MQEDGDTYCNIAYAYAKLGNASEANKNINNAERLKYSEVKILRKEVKKALVAFERGVVLSKEDEEAAMYSIIDTNDKKDEHNVLSEDETDERNSRNDEEEDDDDDDDSVFGDYVDGEEK